MGVFCVPKSLVGMPELVLYGIRLLAKQFLEVDQSAVTSLSPVRLRLRYSRGKTDRLDEVIKDGRSGEFQ